MVAFVTQMTEMDLLFVACFAVLRWCVVGNEDTLGMAVYARYCINCSALWRLPVSDQRLLSDGPDRSCYHQLSGIALNSAQHYLHSMKVSF